MEDNQVTKTLSKYMSVNPMNVIQALVMVLFSIITAGTTWVFTTAFDNAERIRSYESQVKHLEDLVSNLREENSAQWRALNASSTSSNALAADVKSAREQVILLKELALSYRYPEPSTTEAVMEAEEPVATAARPVEEDPVAPAAGGIQDVLPKPMQYKIVRETMDNGKVVTRRVPVEEDINAFKSRWTQQQALPPRPPAASR